MTQAEKTKAIETLENRMFILEMKDGWDWRDFRMMDEMRDELRKLKAVEVEG